MWIKIILFGVVKLTLKDILDEYNKRKSIRAAAAALDISQSVVRKVLITYRVIDSPLIRRIAELRAAGMPNKDIADLLKVSTSCVDANSSYSRGTYLNPSMTVNAIRIRDWRQKKQTPEGAPE